MVSSIDVMFQSWTLVWVGMFGSCDISSSMLIAFDALTPGVYLVVCSALIASLAALLMFLGTLVSSTILCSRVIACWIFSSVMVFHPMY